MPDTTEVLLEPVAEPALTADQLVPAALADREVSALLGVSKPETVIGSPPQWESREGEQRGAYRALLYATQSGQAVEVFGDTDRPGEFRARPSAHVPLPSAAELREAAAILRADPDFAEGLIYQPMPPLANVEREDGTVQRRITLGVYRATGSPRHRIVAVDPADRKVDWSPAGVDRHSNHDCESALPVGVESRPDSGGPSRVRVRVVRNGTELWSFMVVRPRDSEPTTYGKGSGVELRMVRYRGRLVLYRAHVPILNVLYDDGVTYRDWQNEETPFQAVGSDPVGNGWRVCSQQPATILESGTDAGNFQGVALRYADGELRIVSEVQAGWYRYISEWQLRDDGIIKPRFGFAGTRNPRTCMRHQHHVYWRLDFDIEGAGNDVVERRVPLVPNQPPWVRRLREGAVKRGVPARPWRVRDRNTNRGYTIVPGPTDGTADSYGVADMWFLRYHSDEIDDGYGGVGGSPSDTQAKISKYADGESIDGTDVVVWYSGHFMHDQQHPDPHVGHIVGPELRPLNWT
ncbi:hypothetical protein ACQPZJ_37055 [Actinoplanes sp. CA-054009]